MENENHYSAIIESLLFASDKPLSAERIQAVIKDITPDGIEQAINSLNEKYQTGDHCFAIKRIARGYQIYTLPDFAPWIKALFSHTRREKLSFPALEVLSIVAYKQPIVKSEIDRFRGVNSEGPLFTLLDRKLITIVGRKPAPGRPLLYGTTQDFLTHFGLNDLDDLPKMEELEAILKRKEASTFDLEPMEMERKPEVSETETSTQTLSETVEETEKNSLESGETEAPIPITIPLESSSPLPSEDETQ
jgi:segregation and condensation protein B